MCDYMGHHFGAYYIDACCIDGYLWDLDSCDEPGGGLTSGGDLPCPKCNMEHAMLRVKEQVECSCSRPPGSLREWEASVAFFRSINEQEANRILTEVIQRVECMRWDGDDYDAVDYVTKSNT